MKLAVTRAAPTLCVLLLFGAPAFAQPQTPVEPPRRLDTTPIPYPPSASGAAEVVLELVVDREGNVGSVHVIEGGDPFAAPASDAARSWHFAPATRDGQPVEARIRVRIDFAPPAPVPTAPPPPPPASPPPPTSPPRSPEQEVTVRGTRSEPGSQQMKGAEVRQMPGSFGDAFRAIEALPGVIPLVSGLPYFLVRGAPPGNTGFFIDGVPVPALFHLGVGAAVIHPGLIDRVDFYPGGYPARFGRFTGGVLSGEILPAPDRPHAEASVRLLDAGALVATPVADGRGDVLASGRYGYPGPLLSLFAPDTGLAYWDYQTRARWHASDRDDVSAFVFGSYDSVTQRDSQTGITTELLGIQFHRADLRWDRKTSETGALRVALTLGYGRSATGSTSSSSPSEAGGPSGPSQSNVSFIENGTFGLRAQWTERVTSDIDGRFGADAVVEPYHVVVPSGSPGTDIGGSSVGTKPADITQTDFNTGAYGELVWRASPHVEMRPGLRVEAFTSSASGNLGFSIGNSIGNTGSQQAWHAVGAIDPRLAVRLEQTPTLAWLAALGVAHQASNIPLPSPGLQFSQLSRGLQAAYQYSAGAELKLPAQFVATANGFVHDYTGLADYLESCPGNESTCNFDGRAIGLELLVRRSLTQRFTGWLSYTLSRTERDAFYLGRSLRRLSEFDRTHVVNVVLAADLGARWRAGARVIAYSGLPYSSTTGSVGPPDSRGPPFVRLDLRLEKRWNALGGTWGLVFEWLNALLSKESIGTSCSNVSVNGFTSGGCTPTEIGPITFPSIGVEASW